MSEKEVEHLGKGDANLGENPEKSGTNSVESNIFEENKASNQPTNEPQTQEKTSQINESQGDSTTGTNTERTTTSSVSREDTHQSSENTTKTVGDSENEEHENQNLPQSERDDGDVNASQEEDPPENTNPKYENFSKTHVDAKIDDSHIHGNVRVTGEEYNFYNYLEEEISYIDVAEKVLSSVRNFFVPSEDYSTLTNSLNLLSKRIYIVYGKEKAGKFTTALGLVLKIRTLTSKVLHIKQCQGTLVTANNLLEITQKKGFPKDTAVIIKRAFDQNLAVQQLMVDQYAALNAYLEQSNSYIILTTILAKEDLDILIEPAKISAELSSQHLQELFDNYCNFYLENELDDEQVQNFKSVKDKLRNPFEVQHFFKICLDDPKQIKTPEEILENLQKAGTLEARSWFKGLDLNKKLLAFMIYLLPELSHHEIIKQYEQSIKKLRFEGIKGLPDPREEGLDTLLRNVKANRNSSTLEFDTKTYQLEVGRQVENYHHLLWTILDDAVEKYLTAQLTAEEHKNLGYVERSLVDLFTNSRQRKVWGSFFGKIGVYNLPSLSQVLMKLLDIALKNQEMNEEQIKQYLNVGLPLMTIPGYALQEICQSYPEHQGWALDELKQWVESPHPTRIWGAAIASWRIYYGLLDSKQDINPEMLGYINENIQNWQEIMTCLAMSSKNSSNFILENFVTFATAYAIERIPSSDSVPLISQWFEAEDTSLKEIAAQCCDYIFSVEKDNDSTYIQKQHSPLLSLVPFILKTGAALIDKMLTVFGTWLEQTGNKDTRDDILGFLISEVTTCSFKQRFHLKHGVFRIWLNHSSKNIHEAAIALLGHIALLDGLPFPLSGKFRIIAETEVIRIHLGRNHTVDFETFFLTKSLASYFALFTNVELFHLGRTEKVDVQNHLKPRQNFESLGNHPNLLLPILEQPNANTNDLITVLALEDLPIDLLDVAEKDWSKWMFFVTPMSKENLPISEESSSTLCGEFPLLNPNHYREFIQAFSYRFTQIEEIFRNYSAHCLIPYWNEIELWRKYLIEKCLIEKNALDNLSQSIQQLAQQFHSSTEKKTLVENNILKQLLLLVMFHFRKNPEECVTLLASWLEQDITAYKNLAFASSKTLLSFFAFSGILPHIENKQSLINLLHHFADSSNEDIEYAKFALLTIRQALLDNFWHDVIRKHEKEVFASIDNAGSNQEDWDRLKSFIKHEWAEIEAPDNTLRMINGYKTQLLERVALRQNRGTLELQDLNNRNECNTLIVTDGFLDETFIKEFTPLLTKELSANEELEIKPINYFLGTSIPNNSLNQTPKKVYQYPSILGPILEGFSYQNIKLILLITAKEILDLNDFLIAQKTTDFETLTPDRHWQNRFILCTLDLDRKTNWKQGINEVNGFEPIFYDFINSSEELKKSPSNKEYEKSKEQSLNKIVDKIINHIKNQRINQIV